MPLPPQFPKIPSSARLPHFFQNWQQVTSDRVVLNWVRGIPLQFQTQPPNTHVVSNPQMKPLVEQTADQEIASLILKGAIAETQTRGFCSPIVSFEVIRRLQTDPKPKIVKLLHYSTSLQNGRSGLPPEYYTKGRLSGQNRPKGCVPDHGNEPRSFSVPPVHMETQNLSILKSQTTPTQSLVFLGFQIDTRGMTIHVPTSTLKSIRQHVHRLRIKRACSLRALFLAQSPKPREL